MNAIARYLAQRLEELGAPFTPERPIGSDDQDTLFRHITSKKFRKWRVRPKAAGMIRTLVEQAVREERPLRFTFNFGGYKHWSLPTFPRAAWEEFFMLLHYLSYLRPIAECHAPGVSLEFLSCDVIIERANNVAHGFQEQYLSSLRELFAFFTELFPARLSLKLVRIVPDLYADVAEMHEDFEAARHRVMAKLEDRAASKLDKKLAKSNFNICWDGKEPWHTLDPEARQRRIHESLILAESIGKVARRERFDGLGQTIRLFCTPFRYNVAIGTTRASITKFWTGVGVVEQRGERFIPRVLSPSQYREIEGALTERPSGLDALGPAFASVPVLPGALAS
ncbi:MAG: hypothetical protein AAGF11_03230 [Myxococcota bacterium]